MFAIRPSTEADDDVWVKQKPAERMFSRAVLHRGIWKNNVHKSIDEKIFSIINFPAEYFSEFEVTAFVFVSAGFGGLKLMSR
jgi:hypothetical protein